MSHGETERFIVKVYDPNGSAHFHEFKTYKEAKVFANATLGELNGGGGYASDDEDNTAPENASTASENASIMPYVIEANDPTASRPSAAQPVLRTSPPGGGSSDAESGGSHGGGGGSLSREVWEACFTKTVKARREDFARVKDPLAASHDNPAFFHLEPEEIRRIFTPKNPKDPNNLVSIPDLNGINPKIRIRTMDVQMTSTCGRSVVLKSTSPECAGWLNSTIVNGSRAMALLPSEGGKRAAHPLPVCVIDYSNRVFSDIYDMFGSVDVENRIHEDTLREHTYRGNEKTPVRTDWFVIVDSPTYHALDATYNAAIERGQEGFNIASADRVKRTVQSSKKRVKCVEVPDDVIRTHFKAMEALVKHVRIMDINKDFQFVVAANEPKRVLDSLDDPKLTIGSLAGTSMDCVEPREDGESAIEQMSEQARMTRRLMNEWISVTIDFKISFVTVPRAERLVEKNKVEEELETRVVQDGGGAKYRNLLG
jgi:hypothetical protein